MLSCELKCAKDSSTAERSGAVADEWSVSGSANSLVFCDNKKCTQNIFLHRHSMTFSCVIIILWKT